jgi:uncharacterized cupredoxin-like copper-binding protein
MEVAGADLRPLTDGFRERLLGDRLVGDDEVTLHAHLRKLAHRYARRARSDCARLPPCPFESRIFWAPSHLLGHMAGSQRDRREGAHPSPTTDLGGSMPADDRSADSALAPLQSRVPPSSSDATAVIAVIVASVAMIAALVSIGFAVRAVNETDNKLREANAVARARPDGLTVTEHDFAITPGQLSVPTGLVDLHVTNTGPSGHELLVFRTDLDPAKFPVGPDGRVDEAGDRLRKVFDSGSTIDRGTTKTFHTALAARRYVLVCNLPGRYQAGMRAAITVTAAPEAGAVTAATTG